MGTFDLGFKVLPMVFSNMPFGNLFGFLFFFLLFLAAVTSSLSMLQPVIAFLEESLGINRKASVTMLGLITALGSMFVVYFSADVKALDTLDFWIGTFMLYILATIQIIIFGWVIGIEKGFNEAHQGASIKIPSVYRFLMKYVTPTFLLVIIAFFVMENMLGWTPWGGESQVSGYVTDLIGGEGKPANPVALLSVGLIAVIFIFLTIITAISPRFKEFMKQEDPQ
jgi:SNF family Na+-dependent transporter